MATYKSILSVRCSREDYEKLKVMAKARRRKVSDLVRIIMEDFVAAEEERLKLEGAQDNSPYQLNETKATRHSSITRSAHRETSRSARKTK